LDIPSLNTRPAYLWERLLGALIDRILFYVVFFSIRFALLKAGIISSPVDYENYWDPYFIILGAVSLTVFFVIQWNFLKTNGQTVGKRIMKIRIVMLDDSKPSMTNLILKRSLPCYFLGYFPKPFGQWLQLIDVLSIFRADRRCLHDYLAGTKVVKCVTK